MATDLTASIDPSLLFSGPESPFLYATDTDLNLLYCNDSFAKFLNEEFGAAPAVGEDIRQILGGHKSGQKIIAGLERAAKGTTEQSLNFIKKRYQSTFTPIYENGAIKGVSAVTVETNHEADQEVAFIQLAASNSQNGAIILDAEGKITWVNTTFERLTGFNRKEALNRPIKDILKQVSTSKKPVDLLKGKKKKKAYTSEWECATKKGTHFWCEAKVSPIVNEYDDLESYLVIISDVTDRKMMEQDLSDKMDRLRHINNSIPGAVLKYAVKPDGTDELLYVSNQVEQVWGVSRLEAMENVSLLWAPVLEEDMPGMTASIQLSAKELTFWDYEWRIRKDGKIKWLNGRGNPSRMEDGTIVWDTLILDVTARKELELDLWEERGRAEDVLKATRAGTWELDLQSEQVWINDRWAEILGYELSEFQNMSYEKFKDTVHPVDFELVQEGMQQHLSGKTEYLDVEFRQKHKSGQWCWVHSRGRITQGLDGKPRKMSGTHLEINKRKAAELEQKRAEEELKLAVNTAKLGIWRLNMAQGHVEWNDEEYRIYGVDRETFDPDVQSFKDLVLPDDVPIIDQSFIDIGYGKPISNLRFRIKTPSGDLKHILAATAPITNDEGQVSDLIGVNMDITPIIQTEMSLRKALTEKTRLFQELHHRIKNNLQLVSSLLYLESGKFQNEDISNFIKDTNSRILAIADIHEQLLHLEEQDQLNINAYLERLADNLVGTYLPDPNTVALKLDIGAYKFNIDRAMLLGLALHEILTNTLKYAFEGMEGKGEISVSMKLNENDDYLLIIEDNGKGFEADQTGKKGSVGLQLIRDFVRQLKGEYEVTMESGCKYTIRFPRDLKSKSDQGSEVRPLANK